MFDGLILSGTGDNNGLAGKAAVRMAAAGCLLAGQEAHAERLQKMVFGGFNKAVEKPRTEFDWLTRERLSWINIWQMRIVVLCVLTDFTMS